MVGQDALPQLRACPRVLLSPCPRSSTGPLRRWIRPSTPGKPNSARLVQQDPNRLKLKLHQKWPRGWTGAPSWEQHPSNRAA